jgi:tyrosinase
VAAAVDSPLIVAEERFTVVSANILPQANWLEFILCPGFRVRKNQKSLTSAEWASLVAAIKQLKAPGATAPTYDDFVHAHHGPATPQAHAQYTFLPWHREYLYHFEQRLRQINPSVVLPYWDWTVDRTIPTPLANAAEWGVTRTLAPGASVPASLATSVQTALAAGTYQSFHNGINGPHGSLHVSVGGNMGDFHHSPSDPLFWLHHAFVDKCWADWSITHPGINPPNGTTLPATNVNTALEPTSGSPTFTHTSAQVFSTGSLRYIYDNGIQGIVEQSGRTSQINGSNNASNKIPAGKIVLCKTTRGKYSKFRIEQYGYDLVIRWTTYNRCGTVFSPGTNLKIRGTWSCDLDMGVETQTDADFWWQQKTQVLRALTPLGGARFVVYSGPFTYAQLTV